MNPVHGAELDPVGAAAAAAAVLSVWKQALVFLYLHTGLKLCKVNTVAFLCLIRVLLR